MDSDDVREDKDDEKEKEKPMMADMNEGYEYIAYDDTGCQEGIKEKKAPSPLLDFGEDCEVESQKLQDDRIGGEKKDAIKDESASSSSEDEAENAKEIGKIPAGNDVASDSESEAEDRPLERKASSCYSSSEEEGKDNNNDDSEEEVDSEEEAVNKREETQDGLNDSLIKKDEDGQSSDEDEVEKEVSVEKETENASQVAVASSSPEVAAEVVQEVDFEAKYQRFLQNEEMEEREDTSTTGLMGGRPEEKEETVGEKGEDKEAEKEEDEADFCLMTDKPREVLNAVPTLEVVALNINLN